MKTYQIELKRTSYVNLTIEAESEDQAEELAWAELSSDRSYRDCDADWNLESIELDEDSPDYALSDRFQLGE